jgi:DNA-binding CsgD family transcriptional regulator
MSRHAASTLVGRDIERAALASAAAQSSNGVMTVALVRGEAGIGKSRLVAEWAISAVAAGSVVAVGRCIEVEGAALPLAPIAGAFRDLVRQLGVPAVQAAAGVQWPVLASLLPDLADGRSPPRQAAHVQIFEAATAVVRGISEERPLVLVLEDVHWSDSLTRDLVGYLARAMTDARLLLVLTTRNEVPDAVDGFFTELVRLPAAEQIEVGRLGRDQVGDLARQLSAVPLRSASLDRLVRLSDGIPFLVEELMAGDLDVDALVPGALGNLLLRRWRRLGAAARQVVTAASLADAELTDGLLRAAIADEVEQPDAAIREAVDEGVLVPAPDRDGYRFRHALLREAVAASLLPGEARAAHGRWGRALAAAPRALDQMSRAVALAHHWDGADDPERALVACLAAAEQCRLRSAYVEQSRLLLRAIDRWDDVPDASSVTNIERDVLRDDLIEVLLAAEDQETLLRLAERELARTDQTDLLGRARWRILIADLNHDLGNVVAPLPDLDDLVALLRTTTPSRTQISAADYLSWVLGPNDPERAVSIMDVAVASAEALGDHTMTLRMKAFRAYQYRWLGLGDQSLQQHLALLPHIEALSPAGYSSFLANMVALNYELGRLDAALAAVADVRRRLGDEQQAPMAWGQMSSYHAATLIDLGRWDEASRVFEAARARYPDEDWPRYPCWRALLHAGRGDLEEAGRIPALIRWSDQGSGWDLDTWTRVALAAARRDLVDIRRMVAAILDQRDIRAKPLTLRALLAAASAEADAAGRARALGDRSALAAGERAVATVREVLARVPWPGPGPDAQRLHIAAELDRWSGSSDPGPWRATVDAYAPLGYPHERGWALLHLAEALVERSDRVVAASALQEATEIASQLGARPLAEEVAALSRRARLQTPQPLTPRDDPPSEAGADRPLGLTGREREVLSLLCAGLSNPAIAKHLYMSPKTASVHVSRILSKLGAANRTQAATIAHRLGFDQPPA